MQACVADGQPLLERDYNDLAWYARTAGELDVSVGSLHAMAASGEEGGSCTTAQAQGCQGLMKGVRMCLGGALLSAIGFALILFYFCPCVKCALRLAMCDAEQLERVCLQ